MRKTCVGDSIGHGKNTGSCDISDDKNGRPAVGKSVRWRLLDLFRGWSSFSRLSPFHKIERSVINDITLHLLHFFLICFRFPVDLTFSSLFNWTGSIWHSWSFSECNIDWGLLKQSLPTVKETNLDLKWKICDKPRFLSVSGSQKLIPMRNLIW